MSRSSPRSRATSWRYRSHQRAATNINSSVPFRGGGATVATNGGESNADGSLEKLIFLRLRGLVRAGHNLGGLETPSKGNRVAKQMPESLVEFAQHVNLKAELARWDTKCVLVSMRNRRFSFS